MKEEDVGFEYGSCLCRNVSYCLTNRPLIIHCCHCTYCQRQSGSAFAINAYIETRYVKLITGELENSKIPTSSGSGQEIYRCNRCRVTTWSHYLSVKKPQNFVFIRVGTLDRPENFLPDIHIYTSSKQPWVVIPHGVASFPNFYNAKEHWRPESLDRLKIELDA